MISVKNRSVPPLDRTTIGTLNRPAMPPLDSQSVLRLNHAAPRPGQPEASHPPQPAPKPQPAAPPRSQPPRPAAAPSPPPRPRPMVIPMFHHLLQRGQKTSLGTGGTVRVCVGWNVNDARCDIDVSAFLLDGSSRVPSDGWFVFYGQPNSPDRSVRFYSDSVGADREVIEIDFRRLDPAIQRIVFVLTIHEAFQRRLNFRMVQDAYLRILEGAGQREILSFQLADYYENVTSMTIGELYVHNGQWKFNPVGNGVYQDLAGQCAIYGVNVK